MLANLSLSGCYKNGVMSAESRDCTMLKSAKDNLRRMAFFGLTEYQRETQYLFERAFGLKFRRDFVQFNHSHAREVDISQLQRSEISRRNQLDIELYRYGRELFFRRLETALKHESALRASDIGPDRHGRVDERAGTNTVTVGEEYEDSEDSDVDDDKEYNHRIAEQRRRSHHVRDVTNVNSLTV